MLVSALCAWLTSDAMSNFDTTHNKQSNLSQLPNEVLIIIFKYLDVLDLVNCELVCNRWRDVLSHNIIWSKLHNRKCKHCKTYQRSQKIVELEDEQFVHYGISEKCKIISRKMQELDTNWRMGNYQMKIASWDRDLHVRFKNDDDYLLCRMNSINQFRIINRRSMKREEVLNSRFYYVSDFQISGNIIVIASDEFIRVFVATTAEQVNELVVPKNWKVVNLCLGQGILVALSENSQDRPKSRQLTVWRVNSATDIYHLVNLPIAGDEYEKRTTGVALDRRYIVVFLQPAMETYFVSTESWTILERSPTITDAGGRILHYDRGLLFTQKDNSIRLMNVFTGDCREINLEPFGLSSECTQIRTNSKYLVVMNELAKLTRVGIFRITSVCDTPFCYLEIPMAVKWFEMDETELICVGVIRKIHKHIVVIDFLPTPPSMELRRTTSSESLSSDYATAWRFILPTKKSIKHDLHSMTVMIAHDSIKT